MKYAFLLINCDQNKDDEVFEKLNLMSEIKQVTKVVGAYDIVAKIISKNQSQLDQITIPTIKKIKEIKKIKTLTGSIA